MRYLIPLFLTAALVLGCKNQPAGNDNENTVPVAETVTTAEDIAAEAAAAGTDVKFNPDAPVFTVLYATSEDFFVNVREEASNKAAIVDTINGQFHGMGDGVLIEKNEKWDKVRGASGKVGYSNNKYLGYMTWYEGNGSAVMIAAREDTPVYGENYSGEGGLPVFCTVAEGTILADADYEETEEYYALLSGHDYLFLKKGDVAFVNP